MSDPETCFTGAEKRNYFSEKYLILKNVQTLMGHSGPGLVWFVGGLCQKPVLSGSAKRSTEAVLQTK